MLVGNKGSTISSILAETGCFVELPAPSDKSELVVIRGPYAKLSNALTFVVNQANSVIYGDIDITSIFSKSKPDLFMRYMYLKQRNFYKSLEQTYESTISFKSENNIHSLELESKNESNSLDLKRELLVFIKDFANTCIFQEISIPRTFHRFIIGKSGSNILKIKAMSDWNSRLVDVIVPNESDESDNIIIVIKKSTDSIDSLKEGNDFIEKIKSVLISQSSALADFDVQVIDIDSKFHGKLIGAGGERLKEILSFSKGSVSVSFPSSKGNSPTESGVLNENTVTVRGPKSQVDQAVRNISSLVSEWKEHIALNSFVERVKVSKGIASKLVGSDSPNGIVWLTKALRERSPDEKSSIKIDTDESSSSNDIIIVTGTSSHVLLARKLLLEKEILVADLVTERVSIFEQVCEAARQRISNTLDLKDKVLRQLIGKDGRGIKRLSSNHHVNLKFVSREESENETDPVAVGTVFIKGTTNQVEDCRIELINLTEYEVFFIKFRFCIPFR